MCCRARSGSPKDTSHDPAPRPHPARGPRLPPRLCPGAAAGRAAVEHGRRAALSRVEVRMRTAETLMSFTESLPPDKRQLAWTPIQTLTLTLRDPQGIWTAF